MAIPLPPLSLNAADNGHALSGQSPVSTGSVNFAPKFAADNTVLWVLAGLAGAGLYLYWRK